MRHSSPRTPSTWATLATLAALTGLTLAARPSYAEESKKAEAYRDSYALEGRGDYDGALKAIAPFAAPNTDYVAVLRRAWLQYLGAHYPEALISYEAAGKLEPAAIEPKMGALLSLMAVRKWKEAEKVASEVVKLAPGDFTAQSRLAYVLYMLERFEPAEAAYRRLIAAYPSNVEMRAGLAWTLLKLHRFKEARAEFDRILEYAPDHTSARDGRAIVP